VKVRSALCGIAVCLTVLIGCRTTMTQPTKTKPASTAQPKGIPVAELVDVVSKAIQDTQAALRANAALPPLDSVTLTLETVKTKSEEGGIDFLVVDSTYTAEQSRTQTVAIKLSPPDSKAASTVTDSEAVNVYKDLKASILQAAQLARDAEKASGELGLEGVDAEIAFSVTKTGDGTLGYTLEPVDLSAEGEIADEAVHTIEVTFARKKK
jgi:Trypsin-co-occurring domain 2